MRASFSPAATLAHVVPYATFQFSSRTRGFCRSRVMAISALVGKTSSPLWYWWKIVAVRPVVCSHAFSATSRGASVKPPAAAPQSTPQDGTSSAPVTHPAGAVVTGTVVSGTVVGGTVVGGTVVGGTVVGAVVAGVVGAGVAGA